MSKTSIQVLKVPQQKCSPGQNFGDFKNYTSGNNFVRSIKKTANKQD